MKLRFIAAFLLLFIASPVAAQTATKLPDNMTLPTGSFDPKTAYQLPAVYVYDTKISTIDSANVVTGSFTIQNQDTVIQDNLGYQFELVPRNGADTLEYDRFVATEHFSLAPNQAKTISFTYQPSTVPLGDYRLRIRALTSQGRMLGWSDTNVRLGTPSVPFTVFQANGVFVGSQAGSPSEGVNVNPAQPITLQGAITSTDAATLNLTPHVVMYRWDMTGPKVSEQVLPAMQLKPHAVTPFSVQISAPATPDAYEIMVNLVSATGARASTTANYRVVVKGGSAKVVVASFKEQSFQAGQPLTIHADLTGPADRSNSVAATVTIALTENGQEVAHQQLPVTLGLGITPVEATFTLAKTLLKPGMHISIRDQSNQLLDDYKSTVTIDQSTPTPAAVPGHVFTIPFLSYLPWIGGGLVLLAILAVLTWWLRRRQKAKALVTAASLLLVAIGVAALWHGSTAQANGIHILQVPAQPLSQVSLFVNKPVHQGTYQGDVPVEFDMAFVNCSNAVTAADVDVRHANGWTGNVGDPNLPNHVDDLFFRITGTTTNCAPGQHLCILPSGTKTGVIPYSVFGNAQTTVQFLSLLWPSTQARDAGSQATGADVWNEWVNVQPPPATPSECAPDGTLQGQPLIDAHLAGKVFTDLLSPGKGDKGNMTVRNSTSCTVIETLSSFRSTTTTPPANQKLNDIAFASVPPKTTQSYHVSVPADCTFQVDAFAGKTGTGDQVNLAQYPIIAGKVYDLGKFCGTGTVSPLPPPPPTQCSDKKDNDGDNLIDAADPGCHTDGNAANPASYDPKDNDETDGKVSIKAQCSDGVDNADPEDTLVDAADPGCHTDGNANNPTSYNPADNDETNGAIGSAQCSDGIDNADPEDTLADAADPGCHSDGNATNSSTYNPTDTDETDASTSDTKETNTQSDNGGGDNTTTTDQNGSGTPTPTPVPKQCSDGIDNDGDGFVDKADSGCHPSDHNANNDASYQADYDSEFYSITLGPIRETN